MGSLAGRLGSLRQSDTTGGLLQSFTFSLAIQAINVFTGILLARSLGVHSRGELAAAILWPSLIASLGNLGLSDATTYYAAQREPGTRVLVGSLAAIWSVQSVLLCGVGLVVVPSILGHYGPATVHASLLYLANMPAYLATAYTTSLIQGLHRLSVFQTLRFLVVFLAAVGLGTVALVGRLNISLAVLVYLATYATCAVIGVAVVFRTLDGPLSFSREAVRRLLGYAIRSHTDSVASIFNQRLDQLLISIFLAPVQLGLYVIAVTLSSLTGLIGSSVSLVAMPKVARLRPGPERTVLAVRFVAIVFVASSLVSVPMLVFVPLLIKWLFGTSYAGAGGVARVLLVAAVVFNVGRLLSTLLKAVGQPLDAGIAEFVALGATAISLAALLPLFGLMGAAAASLLAYSVSAIWMLRKAARALDLGTAPLLLKAILNVARTPSPGSHAALSGGEHVG